MDLLQNQMAQLEALDIAQTKRHDFDEFWAKTLTKCRDIPLDVEIEQVPYPIADWQVKNLSFTGLDETPIRGWLLLPRQARDGKVPCMIHYHGASGSRAYPHNYSHWLALGSAVIAYDFRLQGGLTGSKSGFPEGSRSFGWACQGLLHRDQSYLYHVTTDALRAVEVALTMPELDPQRIWVNGGSQGGAMSFAIASLRNDIVKICCADVPSCCWLENRLFSRAGGFGTLAEFLRNHPDKIDELCTVLSYFDNLNLVDRINCPTLVSVGLKDPICPPETVYAAYNKIGAEKEICAYPFGEHDGGHSVHEDRKLAFVRQQLFGY